MRTKGRLATRLGAVLAGGALATLTTAIATRGEPHATLPVNHVQWCPPRIPRDSSRTTLRVMTLNVAHGRRDGLHQVLLRRARIENNLSDVAGEIARVEPDVVALQEVDAPSIWSGRFDHVRYLASTARFSCFVHGEHVKGLDLAYGTALLSQLTLDQAVSVTFAPSLPTFSKGFVVSALPWPGRPELTVDIVSVHLDFARRAVRERQLTEMARTLAARGRPLVVMGDFNCDPVPQLAEALGLKAYERESKGMGTFRTSGSRIDWILVSPELNFVSYRTLPALISDHLGVVAEISAD